MKLLYVAGDSKFGGGVRRTSSLVRMAQGLGWSADVLATNPHVQNELRSAGAGIIALDVIRRRTRPVHDLWGAYRLCGFLRETEYTIVHTSTSKGGFVGRLAARLANVPVIVHTVAGFAFHEESSPLALRFYTMMERVAAGWCDRIITVSEFHRAWATRLRIGDGDLVKAIPSGIAPWRVEPTRPALQTRAELGLARGELVILSTGRLVRQKGLEYLIEAARLLVPRINTGVKVVLAGEGVLRSALQRQARRLGVERQVEFLGFRTDVADLLAACDIVALPSLWEGLSISVLEAMAAAKPIVTTTIGSNQEVLRHHETALLVPAKRPDMLAEAIVELASDCSLRKRLGAAARSVYLDRYTDERMVDQYKAEYIALCREKGIPL